jgi:hypothetical protein
MVKLRVGTTRPPTSRGIATLPPRRAASGIGAVLGWLAALVAAVAVVATALVTHRPIRDAREQAARALAQMQAEQSAALAQQLAELERLRGEHRALRDVATAKTKPARQLAQQASTYERSAEKFTAKLAVKQDEYQRLRTRLSIPHATLAELVQAFEAMPANAPTAAVAAAPALAVVPEAAPETPMVEVRPEGKFFDFDVNFSRSNSDNRGTLKATIKNGNFKDSYTGLKARVVVYAQHAEDNQDYLVMKVIETPLDLASRATAVVADLSFKLHFKHPDPPPKDRPAEQFDYAGYVVLLCTAEGELIKGKPYRTYQQKHLANYLTLKVGDRCSAIGEKAEEDAP